MATQQFFTATVAALNDDGTVSLSYSIDSTDDLILDVPCSQAYSQRIIGDSVLVQVVHNRLLVVGTTVPGPAVVDALSVQLANLTDTVTLLQRQVSSLSPPAPAPVKASVAVADQGSWLTGSSQTSEFVKQGSVAGPDWYGGWFYGSALVNACSGKSLTKVTINLTRARNDGGWNRGVPMHLMLHSLTAKADPSSAWLSGPGSITVSLAPGQSLSRDITDSDWLSALKAGSAAGIGISGTGQSDYLTAGTASGGIVVHYN